MDNKYQKITRYLQNEFDAGNLKPGAKLPSIREMATLCQCNKATAIRAYNELEQKHIIYAVPKSGYYIVDKKAPVNPVKNQIDFLTVAPDSTVLPYTDFQHCFSQAIETYKESLFSYLHAPGLPSLCRILAEFLQNYQIFTPVENIFVTAGSQQALHILANIPFPNGNNNVLVEQPTYFGFIQCCKLSTVTILGIERTTEGINLEELERHFRSGNIKFFYTIPRFHNPLGTSYTNGQKKEILNLAQKYNVYIVEDDYLADLEVDSKSDPIYAFDTTGRVVYVRSFSKTVMPGLRLGIAVLPKLLVNSFREYKHCTDLSTSIISQGALEIYINNGMFSTHLRKVKKLYRDKMNQLKRACQTYLPAEVIASIPETGFLTCFELPFKANYLVNSLQNRDVRVADIENMFLPEFQKDNIIRLSLCRANMEQIHEGVSIIGQMAKALLNKPPYEDVQFRNQII